MKYVSTQARQLKKCSLKSLNASDQCQGEYKAQRNTAEAPLAPKQGPCSSPGVSQAPHSFLPLTICSLQLLLPQEYLFQTGIAHSLWCRQARCVFSDTTTVTAASRELIICQEWEKACHSFKALFINFKASVIYSYLPT